MSQTPALLKISGFYKNVNNAATEENPFVQRKVPYLNFATWPESERYGTQLLITDPRNLPPVGLQMVNLLAGFEAVN